MNAALRAGRRSSRAALSRGLVQSPVMVARFCAPMSSTPSQDGAHLVQAVEPAPHARKRGQRPLQVAVGKLEGHLRVPVRNAGSPGQALVLVERVALLARRLGGRLPIRHHDGEVAVLKLAVLERGLGGLRTAGIAERRMAVANVGHSHSTLRDFSRAWARVWARAPQTQPFSFVSAIAGGWWLDAVRTAGRSPCAWPGRDPQVGMAQQAGVPSSEGVLAGDTSLFPWVSPFGTRFRTDDTHFKRTLSPIHVR